MIAKVDRSAPMSIAKDFHWEMGHRLPYHTGGCQNIHGHSYRMRVTIDGYTNDQGMVMDYFELKEIVDPIIAGIDHSFLCDEADREMLAFFATTPLKHTVVPFFTTAENLTRWMLETITEKLDPYGNLTALSVRVHETERTYAELSVVLTPSASHQQADQ